LTFRPELEQSILLPAFQEVFMVQYPHRFLQALTYKGHSLHPVFANKFSKHLLLPHPIMHSFININALAIAAVALTVLCMAPSKANADIITYAADECNSEPSVDFPCDGICRSFANRRSFRVRAGLKDLPFSNTHPYITIH
jgi:hypothetical protein